MRQRLDVRVGAETIEVLDGARVVACYGRDRKGDEVLVLDHYLEVLARKPGAMLSATPLARARASGAFTPTHERFWNLARCVRPRCRESGCSGPKQASTVGPIRVDIPMLGMRPTHEYVVPCRLVSVCCVLT